MKDIDQYLDDLFNKASVQPPVVSYEETVARFKATITNDVDVSIEKSSSNVIFSKLGILSITILIISTIVVFNYQNNDHQKLNKTTSPISSQDTLPLEINQKNTATTNSAKFEISKKNREAIKDRELTYKSETSEKINNFSNQNNSQNTTKTSLQTTVSTIPERLQNISSDTISPESNDRFLVNKSNKLIDSSERVKNNLAKFPENQILDTAKSEGTNVLFTLNELSSEKDFHRIASLAKEAGIEFKFQVHHQRKEKRKELFLVQDFKIDMSIPETDHFSQIKVKVPKWGKFEVTFGWVVHHQGKAISLTESITINKASSFYSK